MKNFAKNLTMLIAAIIFTASTVFADGLTDKSKKECCGGKAKMENCKQKEKCKSHKDCKADKKCKSKEECKSHKDCKADKKCQDKDAKCCKGKKSSKDCGKSK